MNGVESAYIEAFHGLLDAGNGCRCCCVTVSMLYGAVGLRWCELRLLLCAPVRSDSDWTRPFASGSVWFVRLLLCASVAVLCLRVLNRLYWLCLFVALIIV